MCFFLQLVYIFFDLFLISLPSRWAKWFAWKMTWEPARDSHDFNDFNGSEMGLHRDHLNFFSSSNCPACRRGLNPHRQHCHWHPNSCYANTDTWTLDIFTTGFVIFVSTLLVMLVGFKSRAFLMNLSHGRLGLFRNWGARKLHKFLRISQWNRLQFLDMFDSKLLLDTTLWLAL